jgi:molecular chaperone GrpE (heat shock protein)
VPAAAAAAAGGSSRRGASRREIKDERQRLLEAKQINDESNESLSNTRRVLDETTQRGADVSSVLSEQKQQILRSKQNMDDVNSTMGRARKLLQRMARRTVANKLITAMIIVVELAAIGVIMWRKGYFNKL